MAEQETSSPRSEPQLQKSKLPSQSQRFYNKIQKGIMNNEQLNKLLEDDQLLQSKSIENYLSSMQIALSRFKTVKKVL